MLSPSLMRQIYLALFWNCTMSGNHTMEVCSSQGPSVLVPAFKDVADISYKILSTMFSKRKCFIYWIIVCSIRICVHIKQFTWQLCTFCKFDPFDITLLVDLPVLDGYASLALRTSARNLNFYSPFNNSLSWASAKIKLHFTMPGFENLKQENQFTLKQGLIIIYGPTRFLSKPVTITGEDNPFPECF